MKAVVMTGYGSNNVIQVREMPNPEQAPNEVLIAIKAASLNPIDYKIREGKLRLIRKLRFPVIIGNDLAGIVAAVGRDVTRFKVGDEVYARVDKSRLGAFAEFTTVSEGSVALKPKSISFEEAAGIPLVALTSWQALKGPLGVKNGTRIFIPAGSGGVGTIAIQIAKVLGAYVATTASPKGYELVKQLGADQIINYREDRFETLLKDFDGVFDLMGGDSLVRSFQILKPGGQVVSIAGIPDPQTADDIGANFVIKAIFWLASYKLRSTAKRYGVDYRYLFMHPDGEQLSEIAKLIDAGKIRPVVDKMYPLKDAKAALDYLESGHAKGKVILKI